LDCAHKIKLELMHSDKTPFLSYFSMFYWIVHIKLN